ncbi:MAG: response regulator transcription factor [Zoogloeaceae bacterium]|jgi:DNA-binding response OmpR family regulator|nr:response regulator transcription factor [Zoogloeaceae bacterium]
MKQNAPSPLVFIVEDDPEVARTMELALQSFSFATHTCRNAAELLRRLRAQTPDLCIIDLGLPDMDGMTLMQHVRNISDCGVLIVTGRAHVSDRVMGLELGADDYMVKPFEARELVARIRSVLRRRQTPGLDIRQPNPPSAEFSGWRFNPANNTLKNPRGGEQVLSTAEADLLRIFLANPNRILQREQLLGNREQTPMDRSIDARVSRLRRKLDEGGQCQEIIKTVYGAGYLFLSSVRWLSGDTGEQDAPGFAPPDA